MSDGAIPRMNDGDFALLRDLVSSWCGVHFADDAKYLVERRLAPRLAALGMPDAADYVRHVLSLADRRPELEEIAERLTTNETYFFRERIQLDAFRSVLLPPLRTRPRLSIWSAGCSTGEEPYTLAMLLHDAGVTQGTDVRILGTDISRRALAVARAGRYGRASFRQTEDAWVRRYFRTVDATPTGPSAPPRWEVKPELRALVTFLHGNLLDDEDTALIGEVDVVFCRNVLIYFDVPARLRLVDMLHRRLAPGGYLLLGHSETLHHMDTPFESVRLDREVVYRKRGGP